MGDATDGRGDDGKAKAHGFHERHRKAFVVRGQNEDIGSGHEPQDVVTLTEKRESISEIECTMSLVQLLFERSSSHCGDADRETLIGKNSSRFEENVVALLHPEVGDGQNQNLFSGYTQFGPHSGPYLVLSGDQRIGLGEIHPMYHDCGVGS